MKEYRTELLFILLILFGSFGKIISQCNQTQVISICDMTTIDFDIDGVPDGIINLYTETGTTTADGVWSTTPNISVVLDETTGSLPTWELRDASESITDYQFILSSPDCGDDPVLVVSLILGPYSGTALPPDDDDINYYICETTGQLDLNTVLVTNSVTPGAHINGFWTFTGNNPDGGSVSGNVFTGGPVEYQPGLPRVDQNVYEISYVVPGITPCSQSTQTTIRVSVVRQVDAGIPDNQSICESSILAGEWDNDINVRDFLDGEDIEGFWIEEQNGNPENLTINIKDLYEELIDNGNNLRFGCETYSFSYKVEKRSVVCSDETSTVSFSLYEQLRPFQQSEFPVVCPGKIEEPPVIINLFDLLEFTPGFEYKNNVATHWEFVSGPSDLGLVSKRRTGLTDPTLLRCIADPAITDDDLLPPYYDANGPVRTNGARPGEYRFRYYVCSSIVGCGGNACPDLEAEVVLQILAEDHAGEDTSGLSFCIDQGSVDLRSLLITNGIDDIVETGIWTNQNGDQIDNLFVFPDTLIQSPQEFAFTYSTVSADNCSDSADLTFTIYENANAGAGSGTPITLCSDDLTVTLFDLLEGDPDTTGIWTGPFGYTSPDHLGVFDASDLTLPILGPGDYVYSVMGNESCVGSDQATVTIEIVEPVEIGNDRSDSFCEIDGRVNLFTILDNDTPRIGSFEDIENTGALTPEGVVEFDLLPNPDNEINKIYNFRYVIPNTAPCDESALNVEVQIIDLPEPNVPDQEFCILDAKRLDDIEVDVLNYNWYPTLESDMPIIDNPLLVDNQIYYIATVDADNCESERVTVAINILNMGERFSNGDLCSLDFQDGVSPDGNNQNDTFELFIEDEFNIPVAFPDFDLKIYNRYGATVFEGNRNTEEFRGESNVSIRLGDDLPSGTYFYIFTPNFENNFPIQGSFYLSR
ncbi:gliding motility-associated C-terminal domain-containing protein [uncultured Aquimarina sp.]|uniref:T9SS type B sorting domain-containing protein n=1 Tax=uncultured Aquimarina sp. TaxID=575652 RepID=UPI00262D8C40|nr:gliding motility-associated C-terminal domain-containing protein [uncultured Aquimarina sp.]